jgi:hypothetical protein
LNGAAVVRAVAGDGSQWTIMRDPDGSLNFDSSRKFIPIDNDHMAVAAYEYIAIVQRIACVAPEPAEDGEKGGVRQRPRESEALSDRVTALAGCWRINPDFDRLIGSPDRQDGQEFPKWLKLGIALPDAPAQSRKRGRLFWYFGVAHSEDTGESARPIGILAAKEDWPMSKHRSFLLSDFSLRDAPWAISEANFTGAESHVDGVFQLFFQHVENWRAEAYTA